MISIFAVSAALADLPVYREDRSNPYKGAQMVTVARSIAAVSRSREEAAYLIAIGQHESGFSFRIHFGICRQFECDHGRALSPWQLWRNNRTEEEWHGFIGLSLDATRAAAFAALQHVRFAERACRYAPEPLVGTFRAYAGVGCTVAFRGERDRVATFQAVMRKL